MALRLYNTLTRTKEEFVPIDPRNVRMYVCGPTVYDFAHIGNARPLIVFDVLFRLLKHLYPGPGTAADGSRVTYVRNITDVDDKINARALRDFGSEIANGNLTLNEAIRKVTESTTAQFQSDVGALGCLEPTFQPRATDFVLPRPDGRADMVTLIQKLIDGRHAYQAHGEILFDTKSMPDYGALSKRPLDEQLAGARVAVDSHKKHAADFVLWKESSLHEPGWAASFRIDGKSVNIRGRPGWHIECSAMSAAYLGEIFDIHGGGIDLIFPHHENEVAQSRCAHGTPVMANYWLHNGFLQVEGAKMSKSEGNFITIRQLLEEYPGDVLRLMMLSKHYRVPIDWTRAGCEDARAELLEWSELIFDEFDRGKRWARAAGPVDQGLVQALSDDLNTPLAISRLREMFKQTQQHRYSAHQFGAALRWMGFRTLNRPGYFHPGFDAHLLKSGPQIGSDEAREIVWYRAATANNQVQLSKQLADSLSARGYLVELNDAGVLSVGNRSSAGMAELREEFDRKVESLIAARAAARKARNFAEADRIRAELDAMGVALKDAKDPATGELVTTWEVKR